MLNEKSLPVCIARWDSKAAVAANAQHDPQPAIATNKQTHTG